MINKNLIDFAQAISFKVKDDSAYGFLNGFLVSVYESGTKKSFYIYYTLKSEQSLNNNSPVSIMTISGNLSEVVDKYKLTDYSVKENGIRVSCNYGYSTFYNIIKDVTNEISNISVLKNNICSECDEEIEDPSQQYRVSTGGINMLLCSHCANYLLGNEDEETIEPSNGNIETSCEDSNKNEDSCTGNKEKHNENITSSNITKKGGTFKGIIGSSLFGLGVSICIVLLYIFLVPTNSDSSFKSGYYVNWLSAFTAVSAFFGYKIFSKQEIKINNILITGAISLFLVTLTQYISSIALFSRERFFIYDDATWDRFGKAIKYLIKIPFTDSTASSDFKIYILMDIIFVFVALLIISFFVAPKQEQKIVIEKI